MNGVAEFLHMGGYAQFVWPAYGIAFVVLLANLVSALSQARAVRRDLARKLRLAKRKPS